MSPRKKVHENFRKLGYVIFKLVALQSLCDKSIVRIALRRINYRFNLTVTPAIFPFISITKTQDKSLETTDLENNLAPGPDAVPLFLLKAKQSPVILGEGGMRKMLSFLC